MWGIESEIRSIARKYPNSYQIAFFACCREVMNSKHSGGFSSRQEASVFYLKQRIMKVFAKAFKETNSKLLIDGLMKQAADKN